MMFVIKSFQTPFRPSLKNNKHPRFLFILILIRAVYYTLESKLPFVLCLSEKWINECTLHTIYNIFSLNKILNLFLCVHDDYNCYFIVWIECLYQFSLIKGYIYSVIFHLNVLNKQNLIKVSLIRTFKPNTITRSYKTYKPNKQM